MNKEELITFWIESSDRDFKIRARYDDYKSEFYKLCTKEFTKEWVKKIKGIRLWLKKML